MHLFLDLGDIQICSKLRRVELWHIQLYLLTVLSILEFAQLLNVR